MSKLKGYLCLDCCYVFDSPVRYIEPHGEEYSGCPRCAGSYVQAVECDGCGAIIQDEYIHLFDGTDYCPQCYWKRNVEDG